MKKKPSASPGFTEFLRNPQRLLRLTLIAVLYLVIFILLDLVTKQFSELPGIVAWYPPAGLTYALLLVFGIAFTPAVTIALISDSMLIYHMPQSPLLLISWALIISLIYGAAALFLRKRIHLDWRLQKLRDVTWFVFTIVLVSALLAVLSILSSALSGGIPRSDIALQIFHWWIGETVGVLTITPFLLIYVMPGLKRFTEGQPVKLPARRSFSRPTLSAVGQAASILLTLYWVFIAQVPAEFRPLYIIALPLIWIALQRGFKGVTAAILVLNSGIVLAMMLFRFDLARLNELQLAMIINCIVCLLMGAVVTERKRAEQTLAESEIKFKWLYEYAPSAYHLLTPNGTLTDVNHRWCELLGYRREDVLGRAIFDFVVEEERELAKASFKKKKQSRKSYIEGSERNFKTKDGAVRTFITYDFFVLDQRQNITSVQTTIEDITERKEREEQLQYQANLIESVNDAIVASNAQYQLTAWNAGAEALYGWKAEEVLGRNGLEIVRTEWPAIEADKMRAKIAETGHWQGEAIQTRKDGMRIPVDVSSLVLRDDNGQITGYISINRDITERKQAEESIRRQLADLEMLYENSLSINSLLVQEEIGAKVIDAITSKGISWRHVAVHLYHPEKQQVEILANSYPGVRADKFPAEKQRLNSLVSNPSEGFVGWVIKHGKLIRNGNVIGDRRYIMAYPDIRAGIYVPMKAGDRVIGVISVESEQADAFTETDEHLLITLAAQASVAIENARLFSEIEASHQDLTLAYDATIEGWSKALDFRDKDTEGHSQRVTEMTWKLARIYGLSQAELVNVRWGALLHDIGKMGIPDGILLKPTALTDLEWRIVKKHPAFAFEWLSPIAYLKSAMDIPYCHHEKWDGTGYPRGLKGEAIPLAARMFALVDVYDALTSDRPYRPAWTKKKTLDYIQEQSGIHFDPKVTLVFLDMVQKDKKRSVD